MTDFGERTGITGVSGSDGESRLELEAGDEHLNPAGTVHGGVLATMVDTAMGEAVRSTTGEDEVPATSQLSIAYLRPGKPGHLVATGRVRKQGAHMLVCEAEVEQDGEALVHAVATFAVIER
jgi:uncharacterized protein (TIGR00369 family)